MRLIVSRLDWRPTQRMIEMPTPTSTAYCSGMIIVRTSVVNSTMAWIGPVRTIDSTWAGLMVCAPTTMSRPARAGIATRATTSASSRMMMAITPAAIISDSRVLAPAWTLSEEADIEPPTGMPRKKPARMLPAPWPMKSRSGSAWPSGGG